MHTRIRFEIMPAYSGTIWVRGGGDGGANFPTARADKTATRVHTLIHTYTQTRTQTHPQCAYRTRACANVPYNGILNMHMHK